MQAQSAGSALVRSPERSRTLVARDGAVWIWPGIPLTMRRGHEIVPVSEGTIRFWVALLHGAQALHKELTWALRRAAESLRTGEEVAAQRLLDSLDLKAVTRAGALHMGAVGEQTPTYLPDIYVDDEGGRGGSSDANLWVALLARYCISDQLVKAGPWDSSKHPRWPKGAPERQGGRFAPSDSGDAEPPASGAPTGRPLTVYSRKRPGVGHNQGPPLEEPPEIPEEPLSGKARTTFIKSAVRWLILAFAEASPDTEAFLLALQASTWILQQCYPYIASFFTSPKTLEELQNDVNYPTKGYQTHHNAEKGQANADGIPKSVWDSPENKVRVPTLKHWEITRWYVTPNENYGGLSPRAYLKGKSWDEKVRVGHDALKLFGVLK